MSAEVTFDEPCPHTTRLCSSLKALWPVLGSVVDREDHNTGFLDGVRNDERGIRIDELTRPGNPACSARNGVDGKLLIADDDLHCDSGVNLLAVGSGDEIVGLIHSQ